MIDYSKLKIAHELCINTKYYCIEIVMGIMDSATFFLRNCDDEGNNSTLVHYSTLDNLILKLQELTQTKPKYKIGEKVFTVNSDLEIEEVEISSILDIHTHMPYQDTYRDWHHENRLYPTKQSLIESQIEYWRDQLSEELEQHISPYCEPLNKDEHCQVSGAKLATPKIEAVPYRPIFTAEKILDSIKCEHGFSPRNCFECVMGICQHESDDGLYADPKWVARMRCKKCGEFYK